MMMLNRAQAIPWSMRLYRDLDVVDAAEQVADAINALIDANPRQLIHVKQLRNSTQSVCANIREGFGRGEGPERNHKLRLARGEAEEAITHLRANFASGRIQGAAYWPLRNRLITIVKMLNSLLGD